MACGSIHSSMFDGQMIPQLQEFQVQSGHNLHSREFAMFMDEHDKVQHLRDQFHMPKFKFLPKVDLSLVSGEDDCIYFGGNSLGLQAKNTQTLIQNDLDMWAQVGLMGQHFGPRPWKHCDEFLTDSMAKIVGAKPTEVVVMNGLTVNIHLMMVSFYHPTAARHRILMESRAFPSDHYAVESQITFHGYNPTSSMICLEPREGEVCLRTEDILDTINREGDSIALVFFSGVQYYTGQLFDMPAITLAAHQKGCMVGWDLAHAVGNVPLYLHDWNVDFAVWCTYKYLNSGAGGLAGAFVHEKHAENDFPKFLGWWGHKMDTRFMMTNQMDLTPGAAGYRISNPPPLLCDPLRASLDVYDQTTQEDLRAKSLLLTGYLEYLIDYYFGPNSLHRESEASCEILTPRDPKQRGCQLSLKFSINLDAVFLQLLKRGVVCDVRLPSVVRVAPVHIYNSFLDVYRFIETLRAAIKAAAGSTNTEAIVL